ncbi:MAG: hypothetical protein Q3990_06315 [Desulfovibrionaceae bacterium]|nr:hypothetical protein [Desulfovibrionaceae bacterium]
MWRLWNTLDTVLKKTSDKDSPCYQIKTFSRTTGPVMVRLINGRIRLAGPNSNVIGCPPLAVGSCLLTHREADEHVTIWLGLPPCVTGSELEALLRKDGFCRNNLVTMTRLAAHLEDGKDVCDILTELDVVRRRIEHFLQLYFACEVHCPARERQCWPKDMLVLGVASRKTAESMVQRFTERFACRCSTDEAIDAALKELAALAAAREDGTLKEEGKGEVLGDIFSGCETLPCCMVSGNSFAERQA